MRTVRTEFSAEVMRQAWVRCGGVCEACTATLASGRIDYDHRVPNALGGEATLANCQVLCRTCHKIKTATQDVPSISRAKSLSDRHHGIGRRKARLGSPFLKRRMDGSVVRRDA